MIPYFIKTPKVIQWIFPKRIWAFSHKTNSVYLTFDDGPIPELTPWVLDLLKEYRAKATFFCLGDNIRKHPDIFQRIIAEGHAIGNHTFNHLNGWKTKPSTYLENVLKADALIKSHYEAMLESYLQTKENPITTFRLFRPPYGRITSAQSKLLQMEGFKTVMWTVLTCDFDARVSEKKCLQNIKRNVSPGSIVVFHDSLKAQKNLRYVLPKVLQFLSEEGFLLKPIELPD